METNVLPGLAACLQKGGMLLFPPGVSDAPAAVPAAAATALQEQPVAHQRRFNLESTSDVK